MIRNLRAKLDAIASTPKAGEERAAMRGEAPRLCMQVIRETRPLADLFGFERVTQREMGIIEPALSQAFDPATTLLIDTETTGLARGVGTIAFLIGVGWVEGDTLVIEQYLMLDYDGETQALSAAYERMMTAKTLVSFNGKSFDLPLLTSRMVLSRLRMPERPHLDLLHCARRFWKLRLQSCSLTRLEEAVLGMRREDDLPSAEVPQRFFDYLKTGNFALLDDVLRHNRQDIASMAAITGVMASLVREQGVGKAPEDVYSLGRVFERAGFEQEAEQCYRISMHRTATAWVARRSLTKLYKRRRDDRLACETLSEAIRRGMGDMEAMLELARLYEWRLRDIDAALAVVDQALARLDRAESVARLRGTATIHGEALREQLQRREARLERKRQKREEAARV